LFKITVDPESIDYHFSKSSLIFGVSGNPEFTRNPRILQ